MGIMVVVGIGVAVFGALVLLKFPDRPGGKVSWGGLNVSSAGAGLPLIALGLAAIAIGAARGGDDTGGGGGATPAGVGGDGGGHTSIDVGTPTLPELRQPELVLEPDSGRPGSCLTATGTGFEDGETVSVLLFQKRLGKAQADGEGRFRARVCIPASDGLFFNLPQSFPVLAKSARSSTRFAMADLEVLSPGSSP